MRTTRASALFYVLTAPPQTPTIRKTASKKNLNTDPPVISFCIIDAGKLYLNHYMFCCRRITCAESSIIGTADLASPGCFVFPPQKGTSNMPDTAHRFICDSMLGRLAKNLRMLGFDTLYARLLSPQALAQIALEQQRIILTRRTVFSKSTAADSVVYIRSNDPKEQLREVITACSISRAFIRPFTICLRCNVPLADLAKKAAAGRVPDYVLSTVDHFAACPSCGRVYWKGTHYANMADRILAIME